MIKKDNIFFGVSIVLLLLLVVLYKNFLNLKTEHNILKSEGLTTYAEPEDDTTNYKKGDVFYSVQGVDLKHQNVTLPILNYKKKVLVFTSSECSFCKEYYPTINTLVKEQPNLVVKVLQTQTSPEDNAAFLKANNYNFEIVTVSDAVFSDLNVFYTPTTFILNADNTVAEVFDYAVPLDKIKAILE